MYLMADKEKRAEIKVAAGLVCTLVMLPELTPLLEGAILLAWAYAESVYDVRTLFAGGKVPLLKNKETWHYSLTAALHGDLKDRAQEGKGLDYQDYFYDDGQYGYAYGAGHGYGGGGYQKDIRKLRVPAGWMLRSGGGMYPDRQQLRLSV